jgi:KipI family sensor histidine kinase inhibitor
VSGLPRVEPLGDSALLVVLGEGTDPALASKVVGLAAHIREAGIPGVTDVAPAYGALAIFFDPLAGDGETLAEQLELATRRFDMEADESPAERPTRVLPVRYDGPDLTEVAERTGLERAEVIRRHAAPAYRVHFLGFVPGFAYLGPLDPALVLPRRSEPRRRVPPGSVAIAGAQTGVYPLETPGGWHLIGHTDVVLFDPARDPPNLLAAGDMVRFSPVGE